MISFNSGGISGGNSVGVRSSKFDPISLFKSGDVGVWLDATDLNTMRSDMLGRTQVATTQAVIFALDKSLKRTETVQTIPNLDFSNGFTGWQNGAFWTLQNNYAFHAESSALSALVTPSVLSKGFVKVTFDYQNYLGLMSLDLANASSAGVYANNILPASPDLTNFDILIASDTPRLAFKRSTGATASSMRVGNFRVSAIAGNHSVQRTASKRPLLQSNGVIFDGADDELPIAFDSALSNCTIIRAFNGTVTISTGQAVAITHNITQSYNQYLVINRALTALEQAQITSHFKQKMGSI